VLPLSGTDGDTEGNDSRKILSIDIVALILFHPIKHNNIFEQLCSLVFIQISNLSNRSSPPY